MYPLRGLKRCQYPQLSWGRKRCRKLCFLQLQLQFKFKNGLKPPMKKLSLIILLFASTLSAQTYQPTWDSIDKRQQY